MTTLVIGNPPNMKSSKTVLPNRHRNYYDISHTDSHRSPPQQHNSPAASKGPPISTFMVAVAKGPQISTFISQSSRLGRALQVAPLLAGAVD